MKTTVLFERSMTLLRNCLMRWCVVIRQQSRMHSGSAVVVIADLLAGWACKIHSMARYSVDSTMPAALPACQGLLPSLPGLDTASPEARMPWPSCTPAGQSMLAVLEGSMYIQL